MPEPISTGGSAAAGAGQVASTGHAQPEFSAAKNRKLLVSFGSMA